MADVNTAKNNAQPKTPDSITSTNEMGGVEKFGKGMATNVGVVGEVFEFLWARKMWWMIPMVSVLLLFGLLLVFANASGVAPFIYTMF
ncbi:DUF5989 family protein [Anaerolineales bacterium HSG25]|nr:DUF5989 family protein [Anaerolineales bacterium HSG25]